MISDEELRKNYAKSCEDPFEKKYKWYTFFEQFAIDKDVILDDEFWNNEEKEKIKVLLRGEKMQGWEIVSRLCHDTHLEVCVICKKIKGGRYGEK